MTVIEESRKEQRYIGTKSWYVTEIRLVLQAKLIQVYMLIIIFRVTVLVCFSFYNKNTIKIMWLTNNRNLFLIVLRMGSPRSRFHQI